MNTYEVNLQLSGLADLLAECQRRIGGLHCLVNGEPPTDILQKPAVWLIEQIENLPYEHSAELYKNTLKRVSESFEEAHTKTMTVQDLTEMDISDCLKYRGFGKKTLWSLKAILRKYGLELRQS